MTRVLIYFEHREGEVARGSAQLVTLARQLGAESVEGVVVGAGAGRAAPTAAPGVAKIHVVEGDAFAAYSAEAYGDAVCAAAGAASADVVLFATTAQGRDLAPRVAVKLGAAIATDCIGVSSESDGSLSVERPQYSGKCVGRFTLGTGVPRVVSVRPNSFPSPEPGDAGEVLPLAVEASLGGARVREFVPTAGDTKDVADADAIVCGGRSLKSEENFQLLEDLAATIDAAVGATRAAVDAGYQPHARQIGLTGKVVSPTLYIACGVHGAIQHLAGMRSSRVIVAINTNADAPLFEIATYGLVADLFEVVPALTQELRAIRSG